MSYIIRFRFSSMLCALGYFNVSWLDEVEAEYSKHCKFVIPNSLYCHEYDEDCFVVCAGHQNVDEKHVIAIIGECYGYLKYKNHDEIVDRKMKEAELTLKKERDESSILMCGGFEKIED